MGMIDTLRHWPTAARITAGYAGALIPAGLLYGVLPRPLGAWLIGGITAIFVVLMAVVLFVRLRGRLQGHRLDREIRGQDAGPSRRELAEKEREYRDKWLEGIAKLKKARISLYDLPWYVILGEPGGGKTMTLLNSGMDFPMGKDELPGFGGTRNYNWWFTNSAVFLDTAGRLIFEKEGTTDRAEWEAFLNMLKRRRRCPINGVVIALPADKLMSDPAEHRDHSASILRDRLRQIQNILNVRFPVFLLVTKADLVAGFTEFFNELDSLQRNQLFGWSTEGAFDQGYDPKQFGSDFDALYNHLHALRLQFLGRQASPVELGWIHTYPEAFRALRGRIQDYVDVLFSRNIFAEPLFFRGFYFTSALQEGRPILEVLGEQLSREELDNLEGIFPQSRAFFIHDFYTRKVAREQGMVFRSQKHINRMRLLRKSTMFIGVPLFAALILLAVVGYMAYRNAVAAPMAAAEAARVLVAKHHAARTAHGTWTVSTAADGDAHRAIAILSALERAAADVGNPSGIAALMFANIGRDAEHHIRALERELTGYCLVRPEIARVESRLGAATPLPPQAGIEDFTASLQAYIELHFGNPAVTLPALRRVLGEESYPIDGMARPVQQFIESGGRLAGALTDDLDQRQRTIEAALQRADAYWRGAAEIGTHPRYAWWIGLLEEGRRVRSAYAAILDQERDFSAARDQASFMATCTALRGQIPVTATHSDRLLEALRVHLHQAPRAQANGPITTLGELIDDTAQDADRFWQDCLSRIPTPEQAGEQRAFAQALRERVQQIRRDFERTLREHRGQFEGRIHEIDDLLVGQPPEAPREYALSPAARTVERVLQTEVLARLNDVRTTLEPAIDGWTEHLVRLQQRTPPDTAFDLDVGWSAPRLRELVEAVDRALARYEGRLLLDQIAERLDTIPEAGLAAFMPNHDEDRSRALRFDDLRNRHGASFLTSVVRSRLQFGQALQDAVAAGFLQDHVEVSALLDHAMRQYIEHYLNTWGRVYADQRLQPVADDFEFNKPADWDEFRRWMRDHSGDVRREYRALLESLLTHAVGPFHTGAEADPGIAAELRRHLGAVTWTRNNPIEPLLAVEGDAQTLTAPVIAAWRTFEDAVIDFRVRKVSDLRQQPLIVPSLAAELPPALADEWITRQLQYVIDYGAWLLVGEIIDRLESDELARFGSDRPFLFANGRAEGFEPLQIDAILDALAAVRGFCDHLPPRPEDTDPAGLDEWLARAAAWQAFMEALPASLEISCAPGTAAVSTGPGGFYEQVALRLPGLVDSDGQPLDRLLFPAGAASGGRSCRWRPQDGTTVIALTQPREAVRSQGAEIEPHLLDLARSHYGLIDLLQRHARQDGAGWRVQLTRHTTDIQGLQAEAGAELGMSVTIRFVTPTPDLPPVMDWPERNALLGSRPRAPWNERSGN